VPGSTHPLIGAHVIPPVATVWEHTAVSTPPCDSRWCQPVDKAPVETHDVQHTVTTPIAGKSRLDQGASSVNRLRTGTVDPVLLDHHPGCQPSSNLADCHVRHEPAVDHMQNCPVTEH
jgi:hypothetical protein